MNRVVEYTAADVNVDAVDGGVVVAAAAGGESTAGDTAGARPDAGDGPVG